MSRLNAGKVIAGGLVAGLVYNTFDFLVNMFVMQADFVANAQRLGLDPAAMETPAAIATWITIDFLFGFLVVFTYAAIRPRFGPGPKTAVIAGVLLYLPVTFIMFGLTHGGMMTMAIWSKMAVFQLVNSIVGAIAGAWAYTES
jgi:hypothetical protein